MLSNRMFSFRAALYLCSFFSSLNFSRREFLMSVRRKLVWYPVLLLLTLHCFKWKWSRYPLLMYERRMEVLVGERGVAPIFFFSSNIHYEWFLRFVLKLTWCQCSAYILGACVRCLSHPDLQRCFQVACAHQSFGRVWTTWILVWVFLLSLFGGVWVALFWSFLFVCFCVFFWFGLFVCFL